MSKQKLVQRAEDRFSTSGTMFMTDRNMEDYERFLGIDAGRLVGKTTLDIGAGYAAFQKDCVAKGINVVAIDPKYKKTRRFGSRGHNRLGSQQDDIAAINEVLPFRDSSFDFVLLSYSSIHYLPQNYPMEETQRVMAKRMLSEIRRVLAPGGEARAGSSWFSDTPSGPLMRMLRDTLNEVAAESGDMTWRFEEAMAESNSFCRVLVINRRA